MMSNNKVVLITGGGTGIGKAISLKFAKAGYNVIISYNKSIKDAQETLTECDSISENNYLVRADLCDSGDIVKMFTQIKERFSSLNTLINCAGWTTFIPHKDLENLTEEIFDKIISVNLRGTFLCIKYAVPLLESSGNNSCIVNIASTAGLTGIGSNIAYCASKSGVITMTKSLARVLGPNIRVNAVSPGLVKTKMTKDWASYHEETKTKSPLNKETSPDGVANVVLSIVEDLIYINGENILVDTGINLN